MNKLSFIVLPLLCCILLGGAASARGDLAADVLKMTGARTKIVWAHKIAGAKSAWGGNSSQFELVGFDTADGTERVILPGHFATNGIRWPPSNISALCPLKT